MEVHMHTCTCVHSHTLLWYLSMMPDECQGLYIKIERNWVVTIYQLCILTTPVHNKFVPLPLLCQLAQKFANIHLLIHSISIQYFLDFHDFLAIENQKMSTCHYFLYQPTLIAPMTIGKQICILILSISTCHPHDFSRCSKQKMFTSSILED